MTNSGSQRAGAIFYATSPGDFQSGDSITLNNSGFELEFILSGAPGNPYDLASIEGTSNNYPISYIALDNNAVLNADTSLSNISNIVGDGTGVLETSASALDLSNVRVSVVAIESTNPNGTTFTVTDATTALEVIGGPGDDTLVCSGFALTAAQREIIFEQGSVGAIQDTSGTYVNPSASVSLHVGSGATANLNGGAPSTDQIVFDNSSSISGTLVVNDIADFAASITGFTGNSASSDKIHITGISFNTVASYSYVSTGNNEGTLILWDGKEDALASFDLVGSYQAGTWTPANQVGSSFIVSSDGGTGTLITDPPVAAMQDSIAWNNTQGNTLNTAQKQNFIRGDLEPDLEGFLRSISGEAGSNNQHSTQLLWSPSDEPAPSNLHPSLGSNSDFGALHQPQDLLWNSDEWRSSVQLIQPVSGILAGSDGNHAALHLTPQ